MDFGHPCFYKYNQQKDTFNYAFKQKSKAPVPDRSTQPVYGTTPIPGAPGGISESKGPSEKFATFTNKNTMARKSGISPSMSTSFKTTMPAAPKAAYSPGITQHTDATYKAPKMTTTFGAPKNRAGQIKPVKSKFK
jgi:hypothetical protein